MERQYDFAKLSDSFQALIGNKELTFQYYDMFPIPVEIFDSSGTAIFMNRAHMALHCIPDADLVVGKYNLINDPVCNDQLGYRDEIQRAFKGETVLCKDFPIPIQDLVDRNIIDEKPYESASMDLFMFPMWDGDKLAFVVCVFVLTKLYQGQPDVAKAKEYIDSHWLDGFNPKALAKAVNMSQSQLYSLFRQHTGMAPGDYHKRVKVNYIKKKLADLDITIAEAFAACGEDSRGTYARVFKEVTGMSPKEYRAKLDSGAAEKKTGGQNEVFM